MPLKKMMVATIRFRATAEDVKILERLEKLTGLDASSVLRMGLRKLLEYETK